MKEATIQKTEFKKKKYLKITLHNPNRYYTLKAFNKHNDCYCQFVSKMPSTHIFNFHLSTCIKNFNIHSSIKKCRLGRVYII